MQDVKARQLETVKEHIREVLRPRVNNIVETCVQKEIQARVHHEASIPASCFRAMKRPFSFNVCSLRSKSLRHCGKSFSSTG